MNRTRFLSLFLFSLIFCVTGCAGLKPSMQGEKLRSALSMAETYRIRARGAEAGNNLAQALYFYKIAQKIDPADTEVLRKIAALRIKIDKKSDLHFKRGLSFFRRSMQKRARKEFLTALRINPSHEGAKEYLLKKMGMKTGRIYYAQGGKTLAAVASNFYDDPEKRYIIAYFNNIDINAAVPDGARLFIPDLVRIKRENFVSDTACEDSGSEENPLNLDSQVQKARRLLNKKDYEKALAISKGILEIDPTNADALEVENASCYQMGKKLGKKRQYAGALANLLNVDMDYRDTAKSIALLKKLIREQAETHYRKGVKYFVNEDLVHAISEWKKTLSIDPDHKKAQKDILKAETLLEKLKSIK